MGLDVYLTVPGMGNSLPEGRIFVHEGGQTREITREEWDDRYRDKPVQFLGGVGTDEVFSADITHNLNNMAVEAGIYEAIWRPEEIGITKARQLIELLEKGLALLRSDPVRFQKFNPSNGWGTYKDFVPWVANYLEACRKHPEADVRASR